MAKEAVDLLKRFYEQGNQNLPPEKRHRHRKSIPSAAEAPPAAESEEEETTTENWILKRRSLNL
jgi:hypothetical protein